MATATQLTVSDAATHVGVTRQTIFKAIKSGKLSATQNRQGHLQVNVVELLRVYGELQSPEQVAKNRVNRPQHSATATATPLLQLELERAKLQLERKDFELEQLRSRLEESKERERQHIDDRTKLLSIIDRQTLLLAAPRPARAKPAAKTKAPEKAAAKVVTKPKTVALAKPAAAKKAIKATAVKATKKR